MRRRLKLLLITVSLIVASCSDRQEQEEIMTQDKVSEAFEVLTNVMFDPANAGKVIMAKSCGGMECFDITISDFEPLKLPMVKTRSESTEGYTYWGEVTDMLSAYALFREIKKKYKDKCIEFLIIDSPNGKKVYYKECD